MIKDLIYFHVKVVFGLFFIAAFTTASHSDF